MASTYKKSKGNAGLEGVQFQLDLLTVFSLNALHSCRDWKISSENEEAGKYDDLVLELPGKNVFLQAKFKQNKKISRDQLFSSNSKNADFSLPKYFLSYLEIKSEVKETTVILCTNTNINQKGLQDIIDSHRVDLDSLLHYDGATCPYFTFNKNILPDLRESAESYFEKNLQGKGLDKALIMNENMEDFLRNFQFFHNYPSGEELHQVIERLLHRLGHLCSRITYHEIYRKVEEWFKQPKGEYLTVARTNAMLCEIKSEQYCNALKNYNISFERNDFDFSNLNRIIDIKTDGGSLLHMLRIFQALQSDKAKQLYVNPDETIEMQEHMVEAFRLPRYVFLIIVWQKNRNRSTNLRITSKVREILEGSRYKKIVLLTGVDVETVELVGLTDVSQIDGSMTFQDFSKNSREGLLTKKNIVFQGERVSLEELLEPQAADYYTKLLDTRMLEELVRGEEIKVGQPLLNLDEDVAHCYVQRTFEREIVGKVKRKDTIPEENLFDMTENVVLISDSAGMGKSTILTKLAMHIKQKNARMWVIKMNLIDYTRILKNSLGKGKDTVTLEELMNSQGPTKFKNRFEKLMFYTSRKVVLLLDGVDEIAPNYTSLILRLLRHCQEATNIAKLFATTRPHMTEEVREVLNIEPFKILPFTTQNQAEFLINYWSHNLQLEDADERRKCELYAEMLIDKMSAWTESYINEDNLIGAIPLQVRMIADIFQEKNMWESKNWESCSEFLKGTKKAAPKLPEKFDISKLYDLFICKKRDIFIDKSNPTGNAAADQALIDQFDECLVCHRSLSLKVILAENYCNLFSTYQAGDSSPVLKIGIVQRNGDNLFFVHRTFAEYFVAASILQELQLDSSVEFQKFLIDEILVKYEFVVIRGFLDNCLQKIVDSLSTNTFAKYQFHATVVHHSLIFALAGEGHLAILQLILKNIEFRTIKGKIVNIEDVETDSEDGFQRNTLNYLQIITRKAGVNVRDKGGYTPLHYAALNSHLEMVKFLIDQGADVNIGDKRNLTPLLATAEKGDPNVVRCLVEHCANVNGRDRYGRTALNLAISGSKLEVIKCIVEHGAHINDENSDGNTPLHWAAIRGKFDVIKYIVECGANLNDKNNDGCTALHYIAMGGELGVIKYMVECGATVKDKSNDGRTALHCAAKSGQLGAIKYIVECGACVNDRDNDSRTALHWAAERGELHAIKYLVECGGNVNDRDNDNRTALHLAVMKGQLNAIKYIVECGASVNDRDSGGRTAFHQAALRGQVDVIKYIAECGANVNGRSNNGRTALHWAAMTGQLDTIKYLVECGASVNERSKDGRIVLLWAAERGELDAIKCIVECGANVNDRNSDGRTALHWAAERGELEAIKYLMKNGSNVNDRDGDGRTALHKAVTRGQFNAVKYIVETGANVNHRDSTGRTTLHRAVEKGQLDTIKYIVECGANVNEKRSDGRTALHLASEGGQLDAIKYIIESGADIHDRDIDGNTALHWAAKKGRLDAIKYLVECGANVNDKNGDGRTALLWAAERNYLDAVKYLVECGADINERDNRGQTALFWVFMRSHLNPIKCIVECGANVNDINNIGRTALHWAVEICELDVVKYVVACGANVNYTDNNGHTALHRAVTRDRLCVVKYVVECGASLNARDTNGRTAAQLARQLENFTNAEYLEALNED